MPASESSVEVALEVERYDVGVEFESQGFLGVLVDLMFSNVFSRFLPPKPTANVP